MIIFVTMSIQRDIPQITALRERVESRFGKKLNVHADFLALGAVIEREQRQHISESTLERVWGYSTRGYNTISQHTLDILSQYAAGCYWEDFCHLLHIESGSESKFFNVAQILTSELSVGDRLQIGWLPNRLCEVRYLGNNRFVAEHCENAKMQEGDTFSCLQFSLGRELILTDFHQVATPNTNHHLYIVGTQNGLTTLRLLH